LALRQRVSCHFSVETAAGLEDGPEADFGECADDIGVGDGASGVGVEAHAAGENEWFLRDGDDLGADQGAWEGTEIEAVDGDCAGRVVEDAEEDGEEGTFPTVSWLLVGGIFCADGVRTFLCVRRLRFSLLV